MSTTQLTTGAVPASMATRTTLEAIPQNKPQDNLLDFLSDYVDVRDRNQTIFLNTCQVTDVKQQHQLNELLGCHQKSIVNLHRINDIRRINKFFEEVNQALPTGGIFVGCVETKAMRKERILAKFPPVLNWLYYICDFVFKRFFPKVPLLKTIYFKLTDGRNRVITSVETLGRLYSCGFKVVDLHSTARQLYFVAEKKKQPDFNTDPSYGPLFRMKRVGQHGKAIRVYKVRTMHPYAEYLQEYIYEHHQLDEGGKFKNDIRITTLGKLFRKFWIDEIPMILNVLRGEMKLVGVRPLSSHYLSLYSPELRLMRHRMKPGLVPPFYADMPKTLEEIVESEIRYIRAYEKNPWRTDWHYFTRSFYNIFFKKARSQ